ncbi:hypothetical protein JXA85_03210 [Candidatus Woesearchaeota archaeon]|nr:hypothetical protein [Candidatus Woesearchaeota archaeon]
MKPRTIIIGHGNIGKELERRLNEEAWEVRYIFEADGIYRKKKIDEISNWRRYMDVDLVFLAIPTFDNGTTAYEYMKGFIEKNIPVVTSEKGALSRYFEELKPSFGRIGFSATVGGGTRLLRYARERMNPTIMEIHAVVNGTLNYILNEVASGRSLGEVVEETKKLGYAEPGPCSILNVINGEAAGDVPKKVSILCNMLGIKNNVDDIKIKPITEHDLKKLIKGSKIRRYIVSITKGQDVEEDIIGGFKLKMNNNWYLSCGFKNIEENPVYSRLVPPGVNNALMICEGEHGKLGTFILSGPGAGPGPTANSMMIDAHKLLEKN